MTEQTFLQRQWLTFRRQIGPVVAFVGVLWLLVGVDAVLPEGSRLSHWGIHPRDTASLAGIAFAPFLHEDYVHLMQNTVPLLFLGWLVVLSGRWLFLGVLMVTGLSSGLGSWVFGSGELHIGASGVVFGMLGFLLARGWVARRVGWTVVSLLVGFLFYWNIFTGLFPVPKISWSSHFWGLLGGVGFAWWLYRHKGLPAPVRATGGGTRLMRKSKTTSNKESL